MNHKKRILAYSFHSLFFLVLFLLHLASAASACSCSPESRAPACQLIAKFEVVFLGESLELLADKGVYRFRVDRVYKGIPSDTKEVLVSYGAGTSCATEYRPGKQFIIFAVLDSGRPLTVDSWACSGSRRADYSKADVEFLDSYREGKTGTSVYGKVLQWVTDIGRPKDQESAPLAGAEVILKKGDEQYKFVTKEDGAFQFSGIPEGTYELSARLEPYNPDPASYKVNVVKGGCNQTFIQLKASSSIEGTLYTSDGKPAVKEMVELLRRNLQGEWYETYKMWAETDSQGRFKINDIESGDYLLGYEIWGDAPSIYSAYPTLYYPGVPDRSSGQVITLMPRQKLEGLRLTLPTQHTRRMITIRVVMPDGKPPGGNLLQIFAGRELIRNLEGNQHGGVLVFKGYQEREYQFSARYWIDNLHGGGVSSEKRIVKPDTVTLLPGKDAAEVVLILRHEMKSGDEH